MSDTFADHCSPTAGGSPLAFDPRWRTETVTALARGIEADAAFDRLPILADALEEAGCDLPQVLAHCRHCTHHATDCWVLTLTLDRPPPPYTPDDLFRDPETREVFRLLLPELTATRPPPDPKVPLPLILVTLAIVCLVIQGVVGWSKSATPPATEYRLPQLTATPTPSDEQLRGIGDPKPGTPGNGWDGYNERFTPPTDKR
jgi:hypothetical protein